MSSTKDKPRWKKDSYIVTLRNKKTWGETSAFLQAKSVDEAEFLANQYWGMDYKILKVSRVS